MTWCSVPCEAFTLLSGELSSFASSEHATRTFCPRCGTPLTFSSQRSPEYTDVTTASLDDPSLVPPKADIYVADKLSWVVLDDALPRYAEGQRT